MMETTKNISGQKALRFTSSKFPSSTYFIRRTLGESSLICRRKSNDK